MSFLRGYTRSALRRHQYGFEYFNFLTSRFPLLAAIVYFIITLALFIPAFFFSGPDDVISRSGNNLTSYIAPLLYFGFDTMAQGHIPLWNPHILCGQPFLGNFSSALFYPPNWLHMIMAHTVAINVSVAIHFFLAGWLASIWARSHGMGIVSALMAGIIFMMSGAYFYHTYPGDLPILDSAVWIPLVLLALDKILEPKPMLWVLLGILAVSMQILSGGVQIAYYTAIVGIFYFAVRLFSAKNRAQAIGLFALIYIGAVAMCAVQILPGFQSLSESIRPHGTNYEIAAAGALPPESFLTLISPSVLGDNENAPYFGHSRLWEVCLYIGISSLILAIYGITRGGPRYRVHWILLIVCFVFAMGRYLPLYNFLFKHLPLYGNFACVGRFNIFIALFMAILAAAGLDRMLQRGTWPVMLGMITFGVAMIVMLAGFILLSDTGRSDSTPWHRLFGWIGSTFEHAQSRNAYFDIREIAKSADFAGKRLIWASVPIVLLAAGLLLSRFHIIALYAIVAVVFAELFVFAWMTLMTGPVTFQLATQQEWDTARQRVMNAAPDDRILSVPMVVANMSMIKGYEDVNGIEPIALKRTIEFIAHTQGATSGQIDNLKSLTAVPVITVSDEGGLSLIRPSQEYYKLLRCVDVLVQSDQAGVAMGPFPDPLPRVQIIRDWDVIPDRDQIFAAIADPKFNPRAKVILESAPSPAPTTRAANAEGSARVLGATSDTLEIEARITTPGILLITDSYSRYWRARLLPPRPNARNVTKQTTYKIQPADYCLRAIPLEAGEHHFIIEYSPSGFTYGWITSLSTVAVCLALSGLLIYQHKPTKKRFRM